MGIKDFVADFGAPTDGTRSCNPAIGRWRAWIQRHPGDTLKIPAHHYNMDCGALCFGDAKLRGSTSGPLPSLTIDAAPGTTMNNFSQIGTQNIYSANMEDAGFIATCFSGNTSVTLRTPSDASKFWIGQWVVVAGIQLQGGNDPGYPPNFQRYEFKQISGISGAKITFTEPLRHSYAQTWPGVATYASNPKAANGGPAMITGLRGPYWDVNITIKNVHSLATGTGQMNFNPARTITLEGCQWNNRGPSVSMCQSFTARNCTLSDAANNRDVEIDKIVETATFDHCTGMMTFQSPTPENCYIINGSAITAITGTAFNMTIRDSTIDFMRVGAIYGRSGAFTVTNSTISSIGGLVRGLTASRYNSIGDGVLRTPKPSQYDSNDVHAGAVPGFAYEFAYSDGGAIHLGGNRIWFCVTDLYEDAKYIYLKTNLDPFPDLAHEVIHGNVPNVYWAYPWLSLTNLGNRGADLRTIPWFGDPTPTVARGACLCLTDVRLGTIGIDSTR
jgi:hypothetical protein